MLLSVTMLILGMSVVRAQSPNVAAVNLDRILRESVPAKASQSKLEAEFATRDKELREMAQRLKDMSDLLDKDGQSLTASGREQKQRELFRLDTNFQRQRQKFRDDLDRRRNDELAGVLAKTNNAIKQIAEQQHYVLLVQEAVYVSPRIDITDQVLKALASTEDRN